MLLCLIPNETMLLSSWKDCLGTVTLERGIEHYASLFTKQQLCPDDACAFDSHLLQSIGVEHIQDRVALIKWAKQRVTQDDRFLGDSILASQGSLVSASVARCFAKVQLMKSQLDELENFLHLNLDAAMWVWDHWTPPEMKTDSVSNLHEFWAAKAQWFLDNPTQRKNFAEHCRDSLEKESSSLDAV